MLRKRGKVLLALRSVVQIVDLLVWSLDGVCPGAVPPGKEMLLQDLPCLHGEPLVVWGIGVGQDRPHFWWHGVEENSPLSSLWIGAG